MYISNMTHFLDETGNIPDAMPKEARHLASFHALVVDFATKKYRAFPPIRNVVYGASGTFFFTPCNSLSIIDARTLDFLQTRRAPPAGGVKR